MARPRTIKLRLTEDQANLIHNILYRINHAVFQNATTNSFGFQDVMIRIKVDEIEDYVELLTKMDSEHQRR